MKNLDQNQDLNKNLLSNWANFELYSFNIFTYDRIQARYGDGIEVPESRAVCRVRGGKIEIDAYDNSVHNLKVKSALKDKLSKRWPMPLPLNLLKFKQMLSKIKFGRRFEVVLGVHHDPFQWMDRKYGVAKELLQQLTARQEIDRITINTRSDLIATDEYLEVLKEVRGVRVCLHTFSCSEETYRLLCPGAPSQKRIIAAYEALVEAGVNAELVIEDVPVERKARGE